MSDTVSPAGWELENFRRTPVVLWAHDAGSPPVARAIETWVQVTEPVQLLRHELRARLQRAALVYRLYAEGYMRAVSVGFVPKAWRAPAGTGRDGGLDFTRQELTEYSCVPVPANPSALIETRAKGIDTRPMKTWAERALDELGAGDAGRKGCLEGLRAAASPEGRTLLVALRAPVC